MASIALQQSRMLWPSLTVPFSRPLLSATAFLPSFLPSAIEWRLPSLASVLELFPPFLLAVPKKKTSHSRKAMRSANKGLKDKRSTSCVAAYDSSQPHHGVQTLFIVLAVAHRSSRTTYALNATHLFVEHGNLSQNNQAAPTVIFRRFSSFSWYVAVVCWGGLYSCEMPQGCNRAVVDNSQAICQTEGRVGGD